MLDYNLSGGHRDHLIAVTGMYKNLMGNKGLTKENLQQAHLLGWSMELVGFKIKRILYNFRTLFALNTN